MSAVTVIEENSSFISANFRKPKGVSKKKKWYVTFTCTECGGKSEKIYQKNSWNFSCKLCNKGRKTTQQFILEAMEKHPDKYEYTNTVYVNNITPLLITCKVHGGFSVRPTDFLSGSNCPECAKVQGNKKKEYMVEDWNALIKNKHVKLLSKYSLYYGRFECELHGQYDAEIHRTVSSTTCGCSVCALLQHQKASIRPNLIGTKAFLYYGYFKDIDMYKLGITVNLSTRFSGTQFKVMWKQQLDYVEAIELEHKIYTEFYRERYCAPIPLIAGGTYELYYNNSFQSYEAMLQRMGTTNNKTKDLK